MLDFFEAVGEHEILERIRAAQFDQADRTGLDPGSTIQYGDGEIDYGETLQELASGEKEPVGKLVLFMHDLTVDATPHTCAPASIGSDRHDPRGVVSAKEERSAVE